PRPPPRKEDLTGYFVVRFLHSEPRFRNFSVGMEVLWQRFVAGHSNFFLYAWMPTVVVTLSYVSGAAVCFFLDQRPSLRARKLQPKVHDRATFWRCIGHVFLYKLFAEIPL